MGRESDEEAVAIERMVDDGAPYAGPPRARRARRSTFELPPEPSSEERAALRHADQRRFRLYCFACGRATPASTAPASPRRCPDCGGTMLLELAPD